MEVDGIRECLTVYAHKEPGMVQAKSGLFEKAHTSFLSAKKAFSSLFKRK